MPKSPESHRDLLDRPLFGHVATMRPDGRIQTNPIWYIRDGSRLRMTTTSSRQKARNVAQDDRMSISIHDPAQPYRYLELRGRVVAIEPDPPAHSTTGWLNATASSRTTCPIARSG